MAMVGYWNSQTLACECMTASWLEKATQTSAREPNIPPQDFKLDALSAE